MKRIEIFVDTSGNIGAVAVEGKLLEINPTCLKQALAAGKIPKFTTDVIAWGEIIPYTIENPAQNLEQLVHIKKTILKDLEGNNFDYHTIDKVLPILRILLWQASEHFTKCSSISFKCVVCGKIAIGSKEDSSPGCLPPNQCVSKKCYSHAIQGMLDAPDTHASAK